jgi:hypothetical protein
MITEIVSWSLSAEMSREDTVSKFRASVPMWRANPDLIHKSFLFDRSTAVQAGFTFGRKSRLRSRRMAQHFRSASVRSSEPHPSFNISRPPLSLTMQQNK